MDSSENPKVYNRLIELIRDPYVVVTLSAIQAIEQKAMDEENAASPDATVRPIAMRICVSDIAADDAILLDRLGCLDAKFLSMWLADQRLTPIDVDDFSDLPHEIAICIQERHAFGFEGEDSVERDIELMRGATSGYHLSRRIIELAHFTSDNLFKVLQEKNLQNPAVGTGLVEGCRALAPFILETRMKFPQRDSLIEAFTAGFRQSLQLVQDQPQLHAVATKGLAAFEAGILGNVPPPALPPNPLHPVIAENRQGWKSRFKMKL